jgi:hypothetical protein
MITIYNAWMPAIPSAHPRWLFLARLSIAIFASVESDND